MRIPQLIPAAILLTLAVPAVQAAGVKKPAAAPAPSSQAARAAAQPAPSGQPFAQLDADHDGKISRAEWKGSAVSFAMLDTNGDGVLGGDEMKPSSQTAAPAEANPADTFA